MSRDETLVLAEIQDACEKVLGFTLGMNYVVFVHDDLHLLQGERRNRLGYRRK